MRAFHFLGVAGQIGVAALLLLASAGGRDGSLLAQSRKSQPAALEQTMGDTKIIIRYNRPSARGRALFGALVPWGKEWNPGADEATTIDVSRDVLVNGHPLRSGRYSFWVIPRAERWTLIFSAAADVPHTPYPAGRDVLRMMLPTKLAPHVETLVFYCPETDATHATLRVQWGTVAVDLSVTAP